MLEKNLGAPEFDDVAEAFKWIRAEHVLSQADLAILTGISRPSVINIEAGRNQCSAYVLIRLMKLFNFTLKVDLEPMQRKLKALSEVNETLRKAKADRLFIRSVG